MAGETLKSLAGAAFLDVDVIAQHLHRAIPAEELVLDRYVFLPHARTGIAAALSHPFAWDGPARATVELKVPVVDDRGGLDAEMTVHVHGPGDVTAIDPHQVVRTFPRADAGDAEVDDLVHVELDRPDLPWLFTPAGPAAGHRLVPWLTLIVAERDRLEWGERRGTTRRAKVRRDQLQPLGDAWAWAHAQVMGAKPPAPATAPTLEQRLSEANAAHNLSRVVCPRRLDDHKHYVACLVPTFRVGVEAGLGLTPSTTTLAPAWGTAADFHAGDPASMVELPVYYSWSFGTGEDGSFESLARLLKPRVAPPGVGRRRVDATRPFAPVALDAGAPGAEIVVTGPVVSPQQPESAPDEHWPAEADQHWAPEVQDALVAKLNNPDRQAHAPAPAGEDLPPPVVGPPLYGSNHARQPRLETEEPAASAQPPWFRELNADPRDRIVGGLGTRVVQAEQEPLMAAAWNQVIGVEAANRTLRLAQLAKHVSASLHRRHLARLGDAALLTTTERVHAKVLDVPGRSVWASLEASSLPEAARVGAFRRLAAVRGRLVRGAGERAGAVAGLVVGADGLTRDWVRLYAAPDGIAVIGELARRRLSDDVAAQVAPGRDAATLLAAWDEELAGPAPPDRLVPDALRGAQVPDTVDFGPQLAAAAVRRILATTPDDRQARDDPEARTTRAAHALMLRNLLALAARAGDGAIAVARGDAERLRIEIARKQPGAVLVTPGALRAFCDRLLEEARSAQIPLDRWVRDAARLNEHVVGVARQPGRGLIDGLEAAGSKVVIEDPFAEPPRDRVDAPGLALLPKLDPLVVIPARIHARLTGGTGKCPGWLAPDWLADGRIEPVMAHPRFHHPMYEPLHRYDREWMVPGLGLIEKPDMATLLQTNNRFLEAYLVGLNHELGRELLWRGYPTDQRGTYFDSFWTGRDELVADLHELPWRAGALGAHIDPSLDGRLVFLVRGDLVRRYPGVVAHAVRQATDAGGQPLADHGVPLFEPASDQSPVRTLFHVHLAPNVLLVGFDLRREQIDVADETWWFTLSENPTEPRFGLDAERAGAIDRDNLTWQDFGVGAPGQFLDATQHTAIGFDGPASNPPVEHAQWGATSAEVAYLLFQLPARAAFLGRRMVAGATG
jgi:hypothetical protein